MAIVHYISGGERSGKSAYAQRLALELSDSPYYLATARIWDDAFRSRVKRHINERDNRWTTIEEEKFLGNINVSGKTIVVDCVTLWLTNWYVDTDYDVPQCLEKGKAELERLFSQDANIIIISNEIGMGVHADTEGGRKFTELQGWMNQYIAKRSDKATLMVSGLALTLK